MSNNNPASESSINHWPNRMRWISLGLIVIGVLLLMRTIPVGDILKRFEGWIEGLGLWGPVVYGLIYVVAVLLFVPASALTLGAGAIFGVPMGVLIVSLASTTAAALAFLISRYALRNMMQRQFADNTRFQEIDKAVSQRGWKIVALLRLSPAVPFNLQNYLYGLTGIRFWECILTSWITMLPGTVMYVYLGFVGKEGLEAAAGGGSYTWLEWVFLIIGLIATVVVTVYVTSMARQVLKRAAAVDESITKGQQKKTKPVDRGWTVGTVFLVVVAFLVFAAGVTLQFWTPQFG